MTKERLYLFALPNLTIFATAAPVGAWFRIYTQGPRIKLHYSLLFLVKLLLGQAGVKAVSSLPRSRISALTSRIGEASLDNLFLTCWVLSVFCCPAAVFLRIHPPSSLSLFTTCQSGVCPRFLPLIQSNDCPPPHHDRPSLVPLQRHRWSLSVPHQRLQSCLIRGQQPEKTHRLQSYHSLPSTSYPLCYYLLPCCSNSYCLIRVADKLRSRTSGIRPRYIQQGSAPQGLPSVQIISTTYS